MSRTRTLRRLTTAILVGAMSLIAVPAEACGCICPPVRETFREADVAVVARFQARIDRTTFRYTVQEWLKGAGSRHITVIDHPTIKPHENPTGLALDYVDGRTFRAHGCAFASAAEARIAVEPWERPSGEPPPALFVGTTFAGPPERAKAGAWLDRDGHLLAWDRLESSDLSVCPGGRLAVQVGDTPAYESPEVRVRDLETLAILETLPLRRFGWDERVSCRDEEASRIVVASEGDEAWHIVDPRRGTEILRYGEDSTSEYQDLLLGRDAAAIVEADWDWDVKALRRVDLDSGVVTPVLDLDATVVRAWAYDRSTDRMAILAFDPDTAEDVITVLSLAPDAAVGGPPRAVRLPSGATTEREARKEPAELFWTDAMQLAHWARGEGTVTLLEVSDLEVVCEWRPRLAAPRDRKWLTFSTRSGGGVLLASLGSELLAAYAEGGPLRPIHGFSPGPGDTVVALPALDAKRLLGEARGCAAPSSAAATITGR